EVRVQEPHEVSLAWIHLEALTAISILRGAKRLLKSCAARHCADARLRPAHSPTGVSWGRVSGSVVRHGCGRWLSLKRTIWFAARAEPSGTPCVRLHGAVGSLPAA